MNDNELLNLQMNVQPIPSVFNEGFSYYETISKLIENINELISNMNVGSDEIKDLKNTKVSLIDLSNKYKLDENANFSGSWYGVTNPAYSEPGIAGLVDKNTTDINTINSAITTINNTLNTHGNDITDIKSDIFDINRNISDTNSDIQNIATITGNFGIVGNGIADDTTALNNAILNGGLLILNKTYLISDTLNINNPIKIIGKGKIILKAQTPKKMLNITSANVVIDGIELDGNILNQSGLPNSHTDWDMILIKQVSNVIIQNCYLHDGNGTGIYILSGSNNIIKNNRIDNMYDNSILVAYIGSDNNQIIGNVCKGTQRQNNIFLTANSASEATNDWIYNNIIKNNICLNSGDTGIETGIHSVGTIIEGNIVNNSVNPAILLRDCKLCNVRGNKVSNISGSSAISLIKQISSVGCGNNIIDGNVVFNAYKSGIYIDMGDNNKIVNNTIDMNLLGEDGIKLVNGVSLEVKNNNVVNINPNKGDGSLFNGILIADGITNFLDISCNNLESSISSFNATGDEIYINNNNIIPKTGTLFNATLAIETMTNVRACNNRWKNGRYVTVDGVLATDVNNLVVNKTK